MILEENFAILDEDEDFELLEEEDEILMEGEILDEEIVLNEALITSASNVDTSASAKALSKAKAKIDKAIATGKYRDFKSSDKPLVDKAVKDKGLLKTAALTIAGTAIGSAAGFGANKAGKELHRQVVLRASKKMDKSKPIDSKGTFVEDISFDEMIVNEEFNSLLMEEMFEVYMETCVEEVLNEAKKTKTTTLPNTSLSTNVKTKKSIDKSKVGAVASTAVGAGAGAMAGKALAKKILSGMKYSIFKVSGVTILSLYSTTKEGQAKGKSVCYAIATKTDGSKIMMTRVGLKSK